MAQCGASEIPLNTCFRGKLSSKKHQLIAEFVFKQSNGGKLKQGTQQVATTQFPTSISTVRRI
jgi:hypothetical protein